MEIFFMLLMGKPSISIRAIYTMAMSKITRGYTFLLLTVDHGFPHKVDLSFAIKCATFGLSNT